MKSKNIKGLMITFLTIGTLATFAQNPTEDLTNTYCSDKSHNPKCWPDKLSIKKPLPYNCSSKRFCDEIASIYQDNWGTYHCNGVNGVSFNCSELVSEFGKNLQGLIVKVYIPYVDSCHTPGGCSAKACMPSYGTASIDQKFCD